MCIAIQASYVVVNIICNILNELRSVVGYITSLIHSGILSKSLHFLIGTAESEAVKGVDKETWCKMVMKLYGQSN